MSPGIVSFYGTEFENASGVKILTTKIYAEIKRVIKVRTRFSMILKEYDMRMMSVFSYFVCSSFVASAYGSSPDEVNPIPPSEFENPVNLTTAEPEVDIINGTLAGDKRPEVVRIQMIDPSKDQYEVCTATRIGERHFLTAAHCFVDLRKYPNTNYGVTVEFLHKQDSSDNPIEKYQLDMRVSKQIDEDGVEYVPETETEFVRNDIAVLTIKPGNVAWRTSPSMPIVDNSAVQKFNDLAVPIRKITTVATRVGQEITMFGYGCHLQPDPQPVSDFRKRYGSNTINAVAPTDNPTHFTTVIGALGKDAQSCPGDSGGPVFDKKNDDSTAIVGINSGTDVAPYDTSLIARIHGKRGHWINMQVATPILDSHNNKVFKNFPSFKVYGYKIQNTSDSTITLQFRYGTGPIYSYASLNSTTEGCPTPSTGEGAFSCFATAGLSAVPNNTVGDWVASRQISIGGTMRTLKTLGQGKVRICGSSTSICANP